MVGYLALWSSTAVEPISPHKGSSSNSEIMACEETIYADPPNWTHECRTVSQDRGHPIPPTDPSVALLPSLLVSPSCLAEVKKMA